MSISAPKNFDYIPGDYVFINCQEISMIEWYPFNIFCKTSEGDLVLHVFSNDKWSKSCMIKHLKL